MLALVFVLVRENKITAHGFFGKWKSSRLMTPIYLYESGDWEIRTDDGAVLQYGVWQYEDEKLIWSFNADGSIVHDANKVMSFREGEFRLREVDGTVTTFRRIR